MTRDRIGVALVAAGILLAFPVSLLVAVAYGDGAGVLAAVCGLVLAVGGSAVAT